MKKYLIWTLLALLPPLLAGCFLFSTPEPPQELPIIYITVIVTATSEPTTTFTPETGKTSNIIATAPLKTPVQESTSTATQAPIATDIQIPTNTPRRTVGQLPTPIPDYTPGYGMAVLTGESPYEITIMPGGWQAYQIGPSENQWGYMVDINPRGSAPKGAYIESKIMPEYSGRQWVDVLWIRAPGILDILPVSIDIVPTQGWKLTYENHARLTHEWTGWAMFANGEGCGGVLDISPDSTDQSGRVAYIYNWRVQPEGSLNWVQVVRVQLSPEAAEQNAWLRYYTPGPLGTEVFRKEATLKPGIWNGYIVGPSYVHQGYLVEVIPQTTQGNEVAFSTVRPESNGEVWEDVLRVYVPSDRPPLNALMRVQAVKVMGY
jgi:hypothetical protein